MFNRLSLQFRIIIGFIAVSSFSIIVGLCSFYFLKKVITTYDHVVKINFANSHTLSEMRDNVRVIRTRISILGLKKQSDADILEAKKEILAAISRYKLSDKQYTDVPFVDGEEALYNSLNDNWNQSQKIALELLDLYNKEGSSEKFLKNFTMNI
jgi:hypothetical protein